MLLLVTLSCLLATSAGLLFGPILFPGSTACTAPSGRPGDCVLAAECPASHGRPSQRACGFDTATMLLRFCCERQLKPLNSPGPRQKPRPTSPLKESESATLSTNSGLEATTDAVGKTVNDGNDAGGTKTTPTPSEEIVFPTFPTPFEKLAVPTPEKIALPTPSAEPAVLPEDCGLGGPVNQDGIIVPNISGGRDADRSSWPWAALLGEQQSDGKMRWLCGGALLGPRHVLTAAHCVRTMDRSKLVVRLGEHDVRAPSDTRQERRVRRVLAHPDFRGSLADLALLVLDEPVPLSRGGVHPVCLPPADARPLGLSGWVVGWGQLGFEREQPDVLQEALVTVQETRACEAQYRRTREYESRFPGGWRGSVLCAADETGGTKDACRGDSGGPLSIKRAPDGRYHLMGLVLEGMGCGNPEFPGLYTSVPHYVDWIRREVQNS